MHAKILTKQGRDPILKIELPIKQQIGKAEMLVEKHVNLA